MTIETTVFSQDKRITNDAMRLVRGCFPNIGPAYSDKRKNGRRYKFEQWGHKKTITPGTVKELNRLFAVNNIRAKAYLHEGDGRGGYAPSWDGHLCIRTYNESNIKSNNTNKHTPAMKSRNNKAELFDKFYAETKPSITASDAAAIIASVLDQYVSNTQQGNKSASTNSSNSNDAYTFTSKQLTEFVRKVAESAASQCLDYVRDYQLDEDNINTEIELINGNEIAVAVDMDGIADDMESLFDDVVDGILSDTDIIARWYEQSKK